MIALGACGNDVAEEHEPVLRPLADGDFRTWDTLRDAIDFDDGDRWASFEVVRSAITGGRRRLWFDKEAVTRALESYERPRNGGGPPLDYQRGSVFVAESLDRDGAVVDRAVIAIGAGGKPRYSVFDGAGAPLPALARADGADGAVPASCASCHEGVDAFHPMMSFPAEPRDAELDVPAAHRDLRLTLALLEGRRRGSPIVGLYATVWLARLGWGDRNGVLLDVDAAHLARLREGYTDLLTAE